MKNELSEILSLIQEDEYYGKINKHLIKTLFILVDILDEQDTGCTLRAIEWMCIQSRLSQEQYLSDLIKLMFLGYITRNEANTESENFTIGSTYFRNLLQSKYCKKNDCEIEVEQNKYLKLWLHSKINSIKGESHITKHQGKTVEEIFKIDSSYIIDKIENNHFILSLSTLEILQSRYNYQFPNEIIKKLIYSNAEYLKIEDYLKSNNKDKNTLPIKKETDLEYQDRILEKYEFMMSLGKIKYKFENDRVIILSNFYWDGESKLIDDLTILGNLKISNFLEKPRVIPRGLIVNGYIQFGTHIYIQDDKEENRFDVWMKI